MLWSFMDIWIDRLVGGGMEWVSHLMGIQRLRDSLMIALLFSVISYQLSVIEMSTANLKGKQRIKPKAYSSDSLFACQIRCTHHGKYCT
jgi:hypothetical protein